jgi:hypothetical protein
VLTFDKNIIASSKLVSISLITKFKAIQSGVFLCAAIGVVIVSYFWTVSSALSQLGNTSAKSAHYNLLTDGFLSGQLNLKREAAPELALLQNPYDPVQNGPYRLHDTSYYGNKLYLYFGVTPVLVLFLPYAILTGHYIWHHDAVAILSSAQFLVMAGLLIFLRRKYFPKINSVVSALVVLTVGLTNGVLVMLRRPDLWEIPIIAASLMVMLSLASILGALSSSARCVSWTYCASLFYGLALGARPSVIFGAGILLVPVLFDWLKSKRFPFKVLLASIIPVTIVGLGLLIYNWLRFGSITEFGQKYQLAGDNVNNLRLFGFDFLLFNLQVYFWTPVRWMSYFPFVFGFDLPKAPEGQFGVEGAFGILTNVPIVWFTFGLFFSSGAQVLHQRTSILFFWIGAVLWVFASSVVIIGCFGGACNRYQIEFLPALVLLSSIGIFAFEFKFSNVHRILCWFFRALWVGLLVFSIAFNFFSSWEHWDLFRSRDPVGYSRLAQIFNKPVSMWEDFRGTSSGGPIELKVKFPPFTSRRVEPLLVTGYARYADYLWVEYIDAKHMRFGIEHTSYGGPISPPIELDYAKEHILFIELASLYPPKDHPYHARLEKNEARRIRTRAQVQLDGREVLWGDVPAYDASPQTRWIGKNPWAQHLGGSFTGVISSYNVLSPLLGPSTVALAPGIIRMNLWLPSGKPPGLHEPLVCTGITGAGDLLYLRYIDDQHVVLGFDHWNFGGPLGKPFKVDFSVPQRVEVHLGSLFPPNSEPSANDPARRHLEVRWNGEVVLNGEFDFHPAYADQVYFGANPIGCSTSTSKYSGRIIDIWRGN